jgi:hypothetical protein
MPNKFRQIAPQYFLKALIKPVGIEPLISFRILFGLVVFVALLRNIALGYVEKFYVKPIYYFKFYGFEWVKNLSPELTWILYIILCISALSILFGAWYRLGCLVFFLLFSYFELIDVTHYLNHYYLISLLGFILIFLPANRMLSVDLYLKNCNYSEKVPAWSIILLKYQIGIVYFFAAIAKLNPEWLLHAQPLKIWLTRHGDFPLIGMLLSKTMTAYLFAWMGMIYDLTLPFLLVFSKSRPIAYLAVIIFHLMTALFFNIGIFPFAMIAFTLIFFSEFWHQKIISNFALIFNLSKLKQGNKISTKTNSFYILIFVVIFALWQFLMPLRHFLYPGNVLWTEEGFRFSWMVMLAEKTASITFKIKDLKSGIESEIDKKAFLTEKQIVFMSYQPDMILQFAHFLADKYKKEKGYSAPVVTVDCYVAFNGRPTRRFIDPKVDLVKIKENFGHKNWILLYDDL